jgi:hypothetical protein
VLGVRKKRGLLRIGEGCFKRRVGDDELHISIAFLSCCEVHSITTYVRRWYTNDDFDTQKERNNQGWIGEGFFKGDELVGFFFSFIRGREKRWMAVSEHGWKQKDQE